MHEIMGNASEENLGNALFSVRRGCMQPFLILEFCHFQFTHSNTTFPTTQDNGHSSSFIHKLCNRESTTAKRRRRKTLQSNVYHRQSRREYVFVTMWPFSAQWLLYISVLTFRSSVFSHGAYLCVLYDLQQLGLNCCSEAWGCVVQ
jgi:hypothetical protein